MTAWLATLETIVPGMSPRAPKRNVLILIGYVFVSFVVAAFLMAGV